jgi:hypothetical protein
MVLLVADAYACIVVTKEAPWIWDSLGLMKCKKMQKNAKKRIKES